MNINFYNLNVNALVDIYIHTNDKIYHIPPTKYSKIDINRFKIRALTSLEWDKLYCKSCNTYLKGASIKHRMSCAYMLSCNECNSAAQPDETLYHDIRCKSMKRCNECHAGLEHIYIVTLICRIVMSHIP